MALKISLFLETTLLHVIIVYLINTTRHLLSVVLGQSVPQEPSSYLCYTYFPQAIFVLLIFF